jgi:putative transposase
MSDTIDQNLVNELAKSIKTEEDLSNLSKMLLKLTVERALGAEMDEHLGYQKHAKEGEHTGNNRNGKSSKTLKGNFGEIDIETPRDRNATFEPQLIKKNQTRFTNFDSQILSLYAKGMTTRDIAQVFKEMYDADVSHSLISKVTDAVIEDVEAWQNRRLETVYPVMYLDCIVVKCHQDKRVINKSVYIALAITTTGVKEVLGLWIAENEGSKFWLGVLTELRNRGVEDILIACVDGLKGFPEAINTVFPQTKVQLCVVHLIRNTMKYISHKHIKEAATDLKAIYKAPTVDAAEKALEEFSDKWDPKYPMASRCWLNNWENIIPFFDFPPEIRKIVYTTNAIESLNSVIRKHIKSRKIFPNDSSVFKILYLAIDKASQRWTMPVVDWRSAVNRFAIEFEGRFSG